MERPRISVFIVNYNTGSLLEKCLRSVFENGGDFPVEVFVADNNSSDDSLDTVQERFPQVFLTRYSKNVGFTAAINPLLHKARGKYYLFLHPDVEVLPNTLHRLVSFLGSRAEVGIVGANLFYPDHTPNPCEIAFPGFRNDLLCLIWRVLERMPMERSLSGGHDSTQWSHRTTMKVNWVWNACMMVRREVIDSIGYFDEDFFVWFADWDLCRRATDAGWEVFYLHSAIAIHHERQSFGEGGIPKEEVRYKVDGWFSAPTQMEDRCLFLRKHSTATSIYCTKTVYILENVLRMGLIFVHLLLGKGNLKKSSFQLRTCFQTIQAILEA